MMSGSTVTITVWSSAATKTPKQTGMSAMYGDTRNTLGPRRLTQAAQRRLGARSWPSLGAVLRGLRAP